MFLHKIINNVKNVYNKKCIHKTKDEKEHGGCSQKKCQQKEVNSLHASIRLKKNFNLFNLIFIIPQIKL